MESLVGKRALVTGSAGGIGNACALALAEAGTWVACADIDKPSHTVQSIHELGQKGSGLECNVADERSVLDLFGEVKRQVGSLDILVHCAGVMHEKPLLETETAEFEHVIDVNLKGTFLVGREAIRMMQQRGGRVILIASDLGYAGRETFSPYVASKHGVLGLMRSWSREFAPDILVNAICPGPIDTAMLDAENMTPEWRQRELDIPLARFGQPREIADMAVFLASDKARYITGQGVGVNGGSVMC